MTIGGRQAARPNDVGGPEQGLLDLLHLMLRHRAPHTNVKTTESRTEGERFPSQYHPAWVSPDLAEFVGSSSPR